MTSLLTASEAALAELKEYHRRDAAEILCQGPESCIPARVIRDIEIAIGEAKIMEAMQSNTAAMNVEFAVVRMKRTYKDGEACGAGCIKTLSNEIGQRCGNCHRIQARGRVGLSTKLKKDHTSKLPPAATL